MLTAISNIIKKILSFIMHSAMGAVSFFLLIIALVCLVRQIYMPAAITGLLGTILSWKVYRYGKNLFTHQDKTTAALQDISSTSLASSSDSNDFLQESYQKAVKDYNSINHVIRQLKDEDMRQQLTLMQGIAHNMLQYMQSNPGKVALADQFINYYQDRALSLSQEFLEFETMNVNSVDVQKIKAKTKLTLSSFDEAYEAQFSRMLNDKILELDSELTVANQVMTENGIKDNATNSKTTANHTQTTNGPWGRFQK